MTKGRGARGGEAKDPGPFGQGGMGSGLPDWRDEAPYRRLLEIDRAGLAWEWLRRRRDYRKYMRAARTDGDDRLVPTFAAETLKRWGIAFRRAA